MSRASMEPPILTVSSYIFLNKTNDDLLRAAGALQLRAKKNNSSQQKSELKD